VLILDEPTAVLTPIETEQLFQAVRRLCDEGKSVVFISHKLGEVRRICDRLTVLRRGKVVWEGEAAGVSSEELARVMIGHDVGALPNVALGMEDPSGHNAHGQASLAHATRTVLELESVSAQGVVDISLSVGPGEILGIAGVDGNGQQELSEVVVGLRPVRHGRVLMDGEDATRLSLKRRLALGVAHIPNDRKREALVPTMTVAQNIALKRHDRPPISRVGVLSDRVMADTARRLVGRFDVRTDSVETPVGTLSGGNQQKVVLARELATIEPKLIVAMNPVRGLDVAATQFVYAQLLERKKAGCAVLLISSELDEVLSLSDRVAVMYNGRLTMTEYPRTSREQIGRMMAGVLA